jgi:hypothetical protein
MTEAELQKRYPLAMEWVAREHGNRRTANLPHILASRHAFPELKRLLPAPLPPRVPRVAKST